MGKPAKNARDARGISGYLLLLNLPSGSYFGSVELDLKNRHPLSHGPTVVASLKDMYRLHEVYRSGKSESFLRLIDLDVISESDVAEMRAVGCSTGFTSLDYASVFSSRQAAEIFLSSGDDSLSGAVVVKASRYLRRYWECHDDRDESSEVVLPKSSYFRSWVEFQVDCVQLPVSGGHPRYVYTTKAKADEAILLRAKAYLERYETLCLRRRLLVDSN